jgi:hypothetical protein
MGGILGSSESLARKKMRSTESGSEAEQSLPKINVMN